MDNINIWIIIAQIINFWILFFAFKFFLWDTMTKLLLDRRQQLEKLEQVDVEVKNKLDQAQKEFDIVMTDARKKAWEIEKSAESIAKKNKQKIVTDAETQAASIVSTAEKSIEKERLNMLNSIKSKVVDLSLKLNEKLFDKEQVNKDFMEKELNSIK